MKNLFKFACIIAFLVGGLAFGQTTAETLSQDRDFINFVEFNYSTFNDYSNVFKYKDKERDQKLEDIALIKQNLNDGKINEEEMVKELNNIFENKLDFTKFSTNYNASSVVLLEKYGKVLEDRELINSAVSQVLSNSTLTARRPAAYSACAAVVIGNAWWGFLTCAGSTLGVGTHVCGGVALVVGLAGIYTCHISNP